MRIGGVLLMGAGASGALVLVLEAVGCGRRAKVCLARGQVVCRNVQIPRFSGSLAGLDRLHALVDTSRTGEWWPTVPIWCSCYH